MFKKIVVLFTTLSVFQIFPQPLAASSYQSLSEVDNVIAAFLSENRPGENIEHKPIDRRLRLRKCPTVPEVSWRDEGRLTVHCAAIGWRISAILSSRSTNRGHRTAHVVVRGQAVMMMVHKAGFSITRQMIADRRGSIGDIIPVRANRRSQPIMAEVTGPGRVALPSF